MKDKQAERRKRKRREATMQAERQNAASLYAQYEAERKRLGLPKVPVKPDELMRMYRQSDKQSEPHIIMYGLIAAMIYLYEKHGYEQERLLKFSGQCNHILNALACEDRTAQQLMDELKVDTDIDVYIFADKVRYSKGFIWNRKKVKFARAIERMRKSELTLIQEKALCGLTIPLYVLQHYYDFKFEDLRKTATEMAHTMRDMIAFDSINAYIDKLYYSTGVKVELDGRIMIDE